MNAEQIRAAELTHLAQYSPAPTSPGVMWVDISTAKAAAREARPRTGQFARLRRFASIAAHHPITTGRTCVHAAKMLPTVWRALPWYVLPIVALAALVKCLPLDFGADETLFAVAFALVLWRRPGLLEALYREAQAGKPAPCWCPKHASHTHGNVIFARKAEAR